MNIVKGKVIIESEVISMARRTHSKDRLEFLIYRVVIIEVLHKVKVTSLFLMVVIVVFLNIVNKAVSTVTNAVHEAISASFRISDRPVYSAKESNSLISSGYYSGILFLLCGGWIVPGAGTENR